MVGAHRALDRVSDDAVHTLEQAGDHQATIPTRGCFTRLWCPERSDQTASGRERRELLVRLGLEARELHAERGANARLALHADLAVVRLGDRLHDREAESAAARSVGRPRTVEAIEDVRQLLAGNTAAAVGDLEHEPPAARAGSD